MEAVAKLRNIPMSARKMRLVVDVVRGRNVEEALNILKFTKKEGSIWVDKVLKSAIANWENKYDGEYDFSQYELKIKSIFSDEGSSLKRILPAPQGRAHRVRKRSNHVTVVVENNRIIESDNNSEEEI